MRGLTSLEPDPEKQLKYLDFIDIYAGLDDNERQRYSTRYPREVQAMSRFAERFRAEGMQQGLKFAERSREEGMQQGEAAVLLRQMERKFGPQSVTLYRQRVERADAETLLEWSERLLVAATADDMFH